MAKRGNTLTRQSPLRTASALFVAVLFATGAAIGPLGVGPLGVGLPMAPAHAEDPPPQPQSVSTSMRYQVTFVAQVCSVYPQIMANRVSDDSVEAPAAPGRASAYVDAQPVDPDIESANGNGCSPLNGWRFTLGGGREKKSALSTVTGSTLDVGPTAPDAPRLDANGRSAGKMISGAVTVTLTDDQARLAATRQLWAQGGTPDDPLLASTQPGYGFGVLRCGFDGRAGANVQWIAFPAAIRHVFCFAYYVRSAGPSATLIIRAKTTRPVGFPQRFVFDASPSYTASRQIALTSSGAPADATFVRTAGGAPSQIVAHTPADWRLAELSCSTTGAGQSTTGTDLIAAVSQVTLAPGEIVTCAYTFEPPPSPAGLTLRVFSDLPGGQFGVAVNGDGGPRALRAEPPGDGSAVLATGADLSALTPGQYAVTLSPPATDASLWTLSGIACNGTEVKPGGLTATVTLAGAAPVDCTLRVSHKQGTLDLRAVTVGGVASAAFAVVPVGGGSDWSAVATTTGFGVPASARGEVPAALRLGSYLVTPLAPRSTVEGSWRLSSFACDPGDPASSQTSGADVVPLAVGRPDARCVATFLFEPSTRLQLTLRFAGDTAGRSGAAVLQVLCADGSQGRVVLPADDYTERSLPQPLGFLDPTRCAVDRPDDGAAVPARASVTAVLDPAPGNAPLALPGSVAVARDVPDYTVTVTISYTAIEAAPRQATVLGTFRVLPVALIGAGLVGIGLVILLVMVVRSRTV
jgi:hypothetical protein